MLILIKSGCGQLLGNCEVLGTYETMGDADKAFTDELWCDAKASGCGDDEVHTWLDANGMPCGEHDAGEAQWRVFEVRSPKRNPNTDETIGARTIDYKCAPDPTFRSNEVLSHQATLRWESGKSFECHAPGHIELRIGGTPYEYKAL